MSDTKTHSIVSPSSAERWVVCTPSARLSVGCPRTTSVFAEAGTLAHRLGELYLLDVLCQIHTGKRDLSYTEEFNKCKEHELYTDDMLLHVKKYTQYCMDIFSQDKKATMYVEKEVPLFYNPGDVGTVDNVIFSGDTLYITDLKYGMNFVPALFNKQLAIYAISTIIAFPDWDVRTVVLAIVQPRLDKISIWEAGIEELFSIAEPIEERAAYAIAGAGEFVSGKHCYFCPAKPRCKAIKKSAEEHSGHFGFKDPNLLSEAEMSDVLGRVDLIVNWANSVKEFAKEQLQSGVSIPGYKLVAGTSKRTISDEHGLFESLANAGYDLSLFKRTSCVTLTALTKMVDKEDFDAICSPYISKKEAAPVLTEVDDPREEIGLLNARSAFAEFTKTNT